jgi:alanine racemase
VKANAYGHGLERAASALKDDADGFGILELEGAVRMRQWGCRQPILLLEGFFQENELPVFAEHGFATVVHSEEQLRMLERESRARSTSTSRSTRG